MLITTRVFGDVDIAEDKIISFPGGIVGFPELKRFTLLYDQEKGTDCPIKWLQSIEEPGFALPVMDPLLVKTDYNPVIEDELLKPIGELKEENTVVFVGINVPSDLTRMTVNLQAPLIINADERKGCQVILEGDAYPIRYEIYDILQKAKNSAK